MTSPISPLLVQKLLESGDAKIERIDSETRSGGERKKETITYRVVLTWIEEHDSVLRSEKEV